MTDDTDEIVRLKGHVANLQDIAGKQNAEIERLKAERDEWKEKHDVLERRRRIIENDHDR